MKFEHIRTAYRSSKHDFPTPESPTINILNSKSLLNKEKRFIIIIIFFFSSLDTYTLCIYSKTLIIQAAFETRQKLSQRLPLSVL